MKVSAAALSVTLGVLLVVGASSHGAPVPKGFNSWDSFKGDIDEATFLDVSLKVRQLLLPAGYDTVTVDEFW